MSESARERIARILAETSNPEKLPGSDATEILSGHGTKEEKDAENTGKKAKYPSASGGSPEQIKDPNKSSHVAEEKESDKDDKEEDDDKDDDKEDEKESPFFAKKKKEKDDEDEDEKPKKEGFDAQAHIEALFVGNDALTEDFKSRAKTVFEAALAERETVLREQIAQEYDSILETAVQENYNALAEQLDSYLNTMVDEFMEANQVAINRGVRAEIAESFLEGLRELFVEHGFDVPEGSEDILDRLVAENEELEDALNELAESNIELTQIIEQNQKADVISSVGEALTDVEFDKFLSLAENISYEDNKTYEKKLIEIRESYFNGKKSVNSSTEDADDANGVITENKTNINDPLVQTAAALLNKYKK